MSAAEKTPGIPRDEYLNEIDQRITWAENPGPGSILGLELIYIRGLVLRAECGITLVEPPIEPETFEEIRARLAPLEEQYAGIQDRIAAQGVFDRPNRPSPKNSIPTRQRHHPQGRTYLSR